MPLPESPLVTVILPAFNAQRYVRRSIESIQRQTFACFELLVIDDHSTDSTREVALQCARDDPRLKILSNPGKGLLDGLNFGLREARAPYVARMDADDISEPSRFAKQMDYLHRHPDCVVLGTGVICIDAAGWPLYRPPVSTDDAAIRNELLYNLSGKICHPSVMMVKAAVCSVGGYQQAYHFEDIDLFLRLSRLGKLANLPEPLLRYRLLATSISRTRDAAQVAAIYHSMSQRFAQEWHLPPPQANQFACAGGSPSIYELHREWSTRARQSGFYLSAIKHALHAIRLQPSRGATWWTVLAALFGENVANRMAAIKPRGTSKFP